jgi:hypothetical protein
MRKADTKKRPFLHDLCQRRLSKTGMWSKPRENWRETFNDRFSAYEAAAPRLRARACQGSVEPGSVDRRLSSGAGRGPGADSWTSKTLTAPEGERFRHLHSLNALLWVA